MMIEGGCMCGAARYRVPGPMLWAAYCHCTECQHAARSFCPTCGTPLAFETENLPEETHLYAPSLDDRSLYQPTAHVFWPERVPWLTLADTLPKYERGSQSARLDGEKPARI